MEVLAQRASSADRQNLDAGMPSRLIITAMVNARSLVTNRTPPKLLLPEAGRAGRREKRARRRPGKGNHRSAMVPIFDADRRSAATKKMVDLNAKGF